MKAKKFSLELDDEVDFEVLGICSHLPDYRVAWNINRIGNLHLARVNEGFRSSPRKGEKEEIHIKYDWYDQENETQFVLLKNKSQVSFLAPSLSLVDFFLIIHTEFQSPTLVLKKAFSGCEEFISVIEIDPNKHNFFQSIDHL